ncbi:MAG: hypothetical protein JRN17_04845 [Nitrososphaerota archaeon]|nr:hypothetical protein [Nitrososphaerota archaeon]
MGEAGALTMRCVQINHNFIKPHEGLDRRTPSDAARIKVEGRNKWLTIIQKAKSRQEPKVDGQNSGGQKPSS